MIIVSSLLFLLLQLVAAKNCIGAACPIQYQPNNINVVPLQFIDFSGSPWFFNGNTSAASGNLNTYTLYGSNSTTNFGNILPYYGVVISQTLAPLAFQSETDFILPAAGYLEARATFSFEASYASGEIWSPLGWERDPIYASATFGLTGGTNATWGFDFVVTNQLIYAMYSRVPVNATDGYTFDYLIPLKGRRPEDINTYAIILDEAKQSISWRVDDREYLLITPGGTTIDPKFEIGATTGTALGTEMTGSFYVVFGHPWISTNVTQTPCQGTVFRQCLESIEFARLTRCQRAPLVAPLTFNFLLTSVYKNIQVSQWDISPACPVDPYCPVRPITCPRQVARRERYNYDKPVPPTPPPTPPTPPVPPSPPFDCGCGLN